VSGPATDTRGLPAAERPRRVTIPAAVAPLLLEFPELDRRVWVLAVARLIITAGFSLVMPFLAMHLAVERQISVLRIGLLWTLVGLCSASAQWVSGQVADRIGRRPVLLAAMLGRSVNLAGLGYAIGVEAPFWVIGALCVVNGVMRAFYDPVASAVVASLSAPEERVAAFSLHRVGSSLGWAAGPLIATLASSVDYSTLFYAGAPVTLLAAIAVAGIPETRPDRVKPKRALGELATFRLDRRFVRFLYSTFVFYLLQTQMYHIMAIYAAKHLGLDRAQVATLFTLNGILVVLIQLPAVRYIRRVGTRGALVLGSLGYFIGYLGCGVAGGYLSLLMCVALITLCEIVALPAQQTTVTGMAPTDNVAGYAGVYGFVQGAAQTAGPALGTCLLELASPRGAWFALALLGLLAAWGYRGLPAGDHR
jgi:MFS family permease